MNQHRVSDYKRIERDAYQTIEPWVTEALLGAYPIPTKVGEPACGGGHMVGALVWRARGVTGPDIDEGADSLKRVDPRFFMRYMRYAIVTNPPFGSRGKLAESFIRHALHLTVE